MSPFADRRQRENRIARRAELQRLLALAPALIREEFVRLLAENRELRGLLDDAGLE